MKNKKTLLIGIAVLLVLAAVLLIVFLGGSGEKGKTEPEAENKSLAESTQSAETAQVAEKELADDPSGTGTEQSAESSAESSDESSQILESDGDLIIIIPDDEESDGF